MTATAALRLAKLLCACALLSWLVPACSTTPSKPDQTPPGYSADVTPGNDGTGLIGGAP